MTLRQQIYLTLNNERLRLQSIITILRRLGFAKVRETFHQDFPLF